MVGAGIRQYGQSTEGVVDLHLFIAKLIIMIEFTMMAVECKNDCFGDRVDNVRKVIIARKKAVSSPFLHCGRSL